MLKDAYIARGSVPTVSSTATGSSMCHTASVAPYSAMLHTGESYSVDQSRKYNILNGYLLYVDANYLRIRNLLELCERPATVSAGRHITDDLAVQSVDPVLCTVSKRMLLPLTRDNLLVRVDNGTSGCCTGVGSHRVQMHRI